MCIVDLPLISIMHDQVSLLSVIILCIHIYTYMQDNYIIIL